MKKSIFLFFLLSGLFILSSCDKQQVDIPDAIDTIVLLDAKGNVQEEYRYDRNKGIFIGDVPVQKSGCTTIPGEFVKKTPNNHGGHNYECKPDNCLVCYSNCPQQ